MPCTLRVEQLETRALLAVFTVLNNNDSGTDSLRAAITNANSTPGADEIVFDAATNGTDIRLTGGQFTIQESVTITGNGAAHTVIDAQQASRIFSFQAGDFTLKGVTLKNGKVSADFSRGGAIDSSSSGRLTIQNSTLSGNSTAGSEAEGGAIYTAFGAVTISQSTLSGNSTTGNGADGGAIGTGFGVVTISQSTLAGNSTAGGDSAGGAISTAFGAVTISRSTLSGNSTAGGDSAGGAISSAHGAVTISQSTLSGNFTTGNGADGGAIGTGFGTVTISQSTLTLNNAAQSAGGAIYSSSSPLSILNSIIAGNTDSNNTAPDVRKSPNGDDAFVVTNSLIGRNNGTGLTATGNDPDANGNLIGGDNPVAAIDPQLAALANNGGPTQTHALLNNNSPAIDRGSNALAVDVTQPGTPALTTDQRGNPFARIVATTVDMGAYERQTLAPSFFVVTTNVDELNYGNPQVSLREAINSANGSIGSNTITFAAMTNGNEFDLSLGEMLVAENLTITGNGATNTVIDAQQLSRIFNIQAGNFTLNGVTLKNGKTAADGSGGGAIASWSSGLLTIQNSTLSGNSTAGSDAGGGAISAVFGAVTISQSTLFGNSTAGSDAGGGAIFAAFRVVTINQSTLSGNSTAGSASAGAAIAAVFGAVTISQSTLSGNSTAGGDANGGAVGTDFGAVTFSQSTLSGNSTAGTGAEGGAIFTASGPVTISQSTLTLNHAAQSAGGAIYSTSSPVTILNSIVAGNSDNGTAPDVRKSPGFGDAFAVTNSLIGRNNGTGLTATGTIPGANGNLIGGDIPGAGINPHLAPLANNGGPTQTHALLINSPAFNRGSNALAVDVTQAGNPALTTDQRGSGFARSRFGLVDLGALESGVLDSPEGTAGNDTIELFYFGSSTADAVMITRSTDGGPVFNLGSFPLTSPLVIDALGGTDIVRVYGSASADSYFVSSAFVFANGSRLTLTNFETRVLNGRAGSDSYRFDADESLGIWLLNEAGGGTDTIDFGSTTIFAVNLNLGQATTQVVNTNLTLFLGSGSTFENAVGGLGNDTLTGNSLANSLTGGLGNDVLLGGMGDDTYIFGAPTANEADQVEEYLNQGTDTLSFASLPFSVALNLGTVQVQPVHAGRTLKLNSNTNFENATGGSGADTLTGNAANNRLIGGEGNNILVGLAGNDTLASGAGRDLLIGGLGLDTLIGGGGDDILIAGRTTSDLNNTSLNTLRTEWVSANSYATRIANLRFGVGAPPVALKATISVLNDAGEDDSLTGGLGSDWYFRALDDVITDLFAGETVDVL